MFSFTYFSIELNKKMMLSIRAYVIFLKLLFKFTDYSENPRPIHVLFFRAYP